MPGGGGRILLEVVGEVGLPPGEAGEVEDHSQVGVGEAVARSQEGAEGEGVPSQVGVEGEEDPPLKEEGVEEVVLPLVEVGEEVEVFVVPQDSVF